MSLTKDGFYNIEGQVFEVIRGVEGDCLTLGDEDGGTRISGPKPWGGGQVVKTFVTCEKYGPIEHLEAENAKLRELCKDIWNDALLFEGFWDYVYDDGTIYREDELPHYQERMRECGIEVG